LTPGTISKAARSDRNCVSLAKRCNFSAADRAVPQLGPPKLATKDRVRPQGQPHHRPRPRSQPNQTTTKSRF